MKHIKKTEAVLGLSLILLILAVIFVFLFFLIDPFQYSDRVLWGVKGITEVFFYLFLILYLMFSGFVIKQFDKHLAKYFEGEFSNQITTSKFNVTMDLLNPNDITGNTFQEANDKRLIIKLRDRKLYIWGSAIGMIICIFLSIYCYTNKKTLESDGAVFVAFALLLGLFLFNYLFRSSDIVVFDRMKGIVTLSGRLFVKQKTMPFLSNAIIYKRELLYIDHPLYAISYHIPGFAYWTSFYVWYMDKNRPLPPGSLFDPYREIDFKRRQAQDFPDPIYPSSELITDDRAGYIYGDEKALKIISSSRVSVSTAYDVINTTLYKQHPEIKEEDVILIGVWQDYYVFSANASLNQPLKLFVECPPNAFLVHRDKKKVKL